VELDAKGYVVLKERTMTSVPGVFACGNVADTRYRYAETNSHGRSFCVRGVTLCGVQTSYHGGRHRLSSSDGRRALAGGERQVRCLLNTLK
jgi:hypothetical protein